MGKWFVGVLLGLYVMAWLYLFEMVLRYVGGVQPLLLVYVVLFGVLHLPVVAMMADSLVGDDHNT